jgi:hypothetical protein
MAEKPPLLRLLVARAVVLVFVDDRRGGCRDEQAKGG